MKIRQIDVYQRWFRHLKDVQAKARISIVLQRCRLSDEVAGDTKPVGSGTFGLRIHVGPGYRVYYVTKGNKTILLVVGDGESTQQYGIDRAEDLVAETIREDSW